jgi:hypothetical protein
MGINKNAKATPLAKSIYNISCSEVNEEKNVIINKQISTINNPIKIKILGSRIVCTCFPIKGINKAVIKDPGINISPI